MSDEPLRKAYERGLPRGTGRAPRYGVAAERFRKLVEREGSEEDRLHTLDSLLSTAEGRRELDIVWAAARAARPRRSSMRIWMAAASVLLAVSITGTWWLARPGDDVLRGADSPITLVSPVGEAGATSRFVWRTIPEADRYLLVVVDSAGNDVFAMETRDSSVSLPDSVRLDAGREYLWWVQATTRTGASVTAVTQRVRISGR